MPDTLLTILVTFYFFAGPVLALGVTGVIIASFFRSR